MQTIGDLIFWGGFGLLGTVLHFILKVRENGGKTIPDFTAYIKGNSLNVLLSILTYAAIIGIWITEGIEFIGMKQGVLNGMTPFIAYTSTSLFKTVAKTRIQSKLDPDSKE